MLKLSLRSGGLRVFRASAANLLKPVFVLGSNLLSLAFSSSLSAKRRFMLLKTTLTSSSETPKSVR